MTMTFVIGIAGGSGSGKSTLVKRIQSAYLPKHVCTLNHDSYYLDAVRMPAELRLSGNWDHPGALDNKLFTEHIDCLQNGQEVEEPVYDFSSHSRGNDIRRVSPAKILILDGVLLLAIPELLKRIHLKVFMDVTPDERLARRIRRDGSERGRTAQSVTEQFLKTVQPMHDLLVEPSRSLADVIVPQGPNSAHESAIDSILLRIATEISLRDTPQSRTS